MGMCLMCKLVLKIFKEVNDIDILEKDTSINIYKHINKINQFWVDMI